MKKKTTLKPNYSATAIRYAYDALYSPDVMPSNQPYIEAARRMRADFGDERAAEVLNAAEERVAAERPLNDAILHGRPIPIDKLLKGTPVKLNGARGLSHWQAEGVFNHVLADDTGRCVVDGNEYRSYEVTEALLWGKWYSVVSSS